MSYFVLEAWLWLKWGTAAQASRTAKRLHGTKILAGAHQHTDGTLLVDGEPTTFANPRQALDAGIATVYQDLAVVPLMPVWRNFFLGSEVRTGVAPFKKLDVELMKRTTRDELAAMGIDLRDVEQPIGTLSGGERKRLALARAGPFQ